MWLTNTKEGLQGGREGEEGRRGGGEEGRGRRGRRDGVDDKVE